MNTLPADYFTAAPEVGALITWATISQIVKALDGELDMVEELRLRDGLADLLTGEER